MTDEGVTFGGCPVSTAPLGLGTWAWGDRATWGMGGYDAELTEERIAEAWTTTLDAGIGLIDTAEVYGGGESERIIGRLLAADPSRRDVAGAGHQVHAPSAEAGREGRAARRPAGLLRAHGRRPRRPLPAARPGEPPLGVGPRRGPGRGGRRGPHPGRGVSNYSTREMERIHVALADHGVALASNQVEISLLRRRPDTVGLLDACRRLGVVPLAYSPLGQGRLTGKYSAAEPPPGSRTFSTHPMEQVDRIVAVLRASAPPTTTAPRPRSPCGGSSSTARCPSPAPRTPTRPPRTPAPSAGRSPTRSAPRLDAVALEGTRTLRQRVWQHG